MIPVIVAQAAVQRAAEALQIAGTEWRAAILNELEEGACYNWSWNIQMRCSC